MTSSVAGLTRSSKALSKAELWTCTKKTLLSPSDGLLPIGSTAAFWILVKPLHLRSMLSKSMKCIKNRNACSQHWSTERAQFFSTTMTDHTLHNEHSKSWANWATAFCLICCIHLTSCQLTTLIQASWQLFIGKTLLQLAVSRKCFPRVHWTLKHRLLCYRKKHTCFLLAQMFWL